MTKKSVVIILLFLSSSVIAQEVENKSTPGEEEKPDLTGTNPALFNNVLIFSNEFDGINSTKYFNTTKFRYAAALAKRKVVLRLQAPFNSSNISGTGNTEYGFGDFSALVAIKFPVSKKIILLTNLEAVLNTASQNSPALGQGKSTLAPSVTTVFIVSSSVIFAPSFLQKFSYV